MEKPKTTPKDFFLWAGAIVALYWCVIAEVSLLFSYLDYAFTNLSDYPTTINPYQGGMSYEMASLIILFPVFAILFWLIHRDIRMDATRKDIWVRRWALVFTLFLAGLSMVIDLVVLLNTFLSGEELTLPFLLKVLVILLVAAAIFMHFIADLWGYWEQFPERGRRVGYGVAVLVIGTIFSGFLIVGTPWQAQQYQRDIQKVSDLQNIQSEVVSYWQAKGVLPASLDDLTNSISGFSAPVDAQSGESYGYHVLGKTAFSLCAVFNAPGDAGDTYAQPMIPGGSVSTQDTWEHGVGETCFTRTIDPQLYPATPSRP